MFRDGLSDFCGLETQRAYRHLFNMENYLRFVVKWELVGKHGLDWEAALGEEGVKAREQMRREAALGLIDVERANVMSYLMLSEVQRIIFADANWPLFARKLGGRAFLEPSMVVLNRLRGKAMHCRPWTPDDLGTLEGALKLLSRLTQSYRDERTDAEVLKDPPMSRVAQPLRGELRKVASANSSGSQLPWRVASFAEVGAYLKVGLALAGAGFAPEAPKRLFTGTGLSCFFVAADAVTGRLELYLPRVLEKPSIAAILAELQAIGPVLGELPPDDPDARVERFDGLFGIGAQLPLSLRLPTDG